ncbi:flagellar sheath protein A [Vibrio sp.]|uniref:flagellar sheath protein A n=1 Tax=Vibrio sp. TaxID=678 RepID=UPI003F6C7464
MKKTKMLPLAAIISGLLVGCGGGGGGGGGGGPAQTKYQFTLVTPVVVDATDVGSCTIYREFDDNGTPKVLTYHSIGSALDDRIVGSYSDTNGNIDGSLIEASNGVVEMVLENVPDGGAFTLQEANGTIINAITFSRDVLEADQELKSAYLSVEQSVANTQCISNSRSNDQEVTLSELRYLNASDSVGNPNVTYYFDSQIETQTSTNPQLTGANVLKSVSPEKTMVSQYRTADRSELFQYGFDSWPDNQMIFADTSSTPDVSSSLINFTNISIDVVFGGFNYDLVDINRSASFYHPSNLSNGDVWTFGVEGTINTANWSAEYGASILENWDLVVDDTSLFTLSNANDSKPTMGAQQIDLSTSLGLGSETGFQRVSFQQGATNGSTPYVMRHTIYSNIDSAVQVPTIDMSSVPSAIADDLLVSQNSSVSQSYLFTKEESSILLHEFVMDFRNGSGVDTSQDVLGMLFTSKEVRDNQIKRSQQETLKLSRDDT